MHDFIFIYTKPTAKQQAISCIVTSSTSEKRKYINGKSKKPMRPCQCQPNCSPIRYLSISTCFCTNFMHLYMLLHYFYAYAHYCKTCTCICVHAHANKQTSFILWIYGVSYQLLSAYPVVMV